MNNRDIDYAYALDLLKRFNHLVESEPGLRRSFLYRGWNLLQAYQMSIFADMKNWTRDRDPEAVKPSLNLITLFKTVVTGAFGSLASFVSLIYFVLSGRRILVFSIDKISGNFLNDFRLEALYAALQEEGAPYGEILHTLGGKSMIKNFFTRGRPVIYLESVEFIISPVMLLRNAADRGLINSLDLSSFPETERDIMRLVLLKYLSATFISRARLHFFRLFFRLVGARLILSIDDTRHYNEIMGAAGELSIPSYAIQHGHFTKYHTGWLKETHIAGNIMKPRSLIVWSEYWKSELGRLDSVFSPEEIVEGGEPSVPPFSPPAERGKISILVPYEKDAPKSEVLPYIQKFLEVPNVEIIFKVRSDEDRQAQIEEYRLQETADKVIIADSLKEVLPRVSMAVGTYSTMLYDLVAAGKPVAILKSSIDYGEGMVENGLAELLSLSEDIKKRLEEIAGLPKQELETRRGKLISPEGKNLSATLRDIIIRNV